MSIQIITDSTSDIPPETAEALGIKIIPIYVRFGDKVYRDVLDIKSDEFFRLLATTAQHPTTSQPTPEDFEALYKEHCAKSDGIISIHISSKISGTCNSAMIAKKMLGNKCPIEVIDSKFNSCGLALIAMYAARLARSATNITKLAADIRHCITHVHMVGYFNTMKYLAKGGRLPRAFAAAASILNVKPLLAFRDGEIVRAGLVRSFTRGAERLFHFVQSKKNIAEIVIVHSSIAEQAEIYKQKLGQFLPVEQISVMKLGAGLGVHGGPGVLLVAVREGD
ncbi:MAG: DegV family protein [Dehalococcoidales bacterium]